MKKKGFWLYIFPLIIVVVFSTLSIRSQDSVQTVNKDKKTDQIQIKKVVTDSVVKDGVENDFIIEIEYTLESMEEGTLAIGFNTNEVNAFRMITRKKIKKGTNSIKLEATLIPKDWKGRGDFIVLANISPYPIPSKRYRPLVSARVVIDFDIE